MSEPKTPTTHLKKQSSVGETEHPGLMLRHAYLERLGCTVGDAATALGVSRKTVSELLNGHAGITPEMAVRLARVFGPSSHFWLSLQIEFDLRQAEEKLQGREFTPLR